VDLSGKTTQRGGAENPEDAQSEKFIVVSAETNEVVFEATARRIPGRWGDFQYHSELDFSPLKKAGVYFLRFGSDRSSNFGISSSPYAELPNHLLEFMRQQCCGYNPWLDAVCHNFDGRTAYGPLHPPAHT